MTNWGTIALLLVALVFGLAEESRPCTSFLLSGQNRPVLGKNYDWNFSDGLVLVNKRNVTKTVVVQGDAPAMTWTSRYGNVTFNQYGRDFAHGGMNEAGLVIEVLWLDEAQYPEPDERFGLDSLQWVQHHLDTSASVAEVLAGDEQIRITPDSAPLHFLTCDRSGACAVIEFLDGKMVEHRNENLPVIALTNTPFQASLVFLAQCQAFGGTLPIGQTDSSLDRFARAAVGIAAEPRESDVPADPVTAAFAVLDDVAMNDCSKEECTRWSIVYDIDEGKLFLRTLANPTVRFVSLDDFDFACTSPVKILDLDAPGAGNVSALFTDYTFEANRALITAAYAQTDFLRDLPPEAVDYIASFPEQFAQCQ